MTSEFKIDRLGIVFALMVTVIRGLCVAWYCKEQSSSCGRGSASWLVHLDVLCFLCYVMFFSNDFLVFFFCLEGTLIPMLGMVGALGKKGRGLHAAWMLYMMTFLGGCLCIPWLIVVYSMVGSWSVSLLSVALGGRDLLLLGAVAFGLSILVKVPVIPFHGWLPEAHVEASTEGSVVLAGVLLKLSLFLLLRVWVGFFESVLVGSFLTCLLSWCVLSALVGTISACVQGDAKRVIAYASVAHMSIGLAAGLCSTMGVSMMLILALGHSIIACGLFLSVGTVYEKSHSRLMKIYGGLASICPVLSLGLLCLVMANAGFPGTVGWVSELLGFVPIVSMAGVFIPLFAFCFVGCVIYSLFLYTRIMWGPESAVMFWCMKEDVSLYWAWTFAALLVLCVALGLCPSAVMSWASSPV